MNKAILTTPEPTLFTLFDAHRLHRQLQADEMHEPPEHRWRYTVRPVSDTTANVICFNEYGHELGAL